MKIKHAWSVLCRRTVIDSESNNVSIFDSFEQLQIKLNDEIKGAIAEKKNFVIPIDLEVATLWFTDEKGKKQVAQTLLEMVDPKGKVLLKKEIEIVIPTDMYRLRFFSKLKMLPISSSGIYFFNVSLKNSSEENYKKVAQVPLEILIEA